MEGTETSTMATILDGVESIFDSVIGMAGTVGETVVTTPILLTFALVPLCGLAIGIFRRLLNIN